MWVPKKGEERRIGKIKCESGKELTDRPALRQTMDDDSNRALARTLVAYRSGGSTWWGGNVVGHRWDENCPTRPTDSSPRDWKHFFRAKKIVDSNRTLYFGVFQETFSNGTTKYGIEFRDSQMKGAQCLGVAYLLNTHLDIERKIERAHGVEEIELNIDYDTILLREFASLKQSDVLWATNPDEAPEDSDIATGSTRWGRLKRRRYEYNCGDVDAIEWIITFAAKKRPPPGWFRRVRKRYFGIFKDDKEQYWLEFRNSRLSSARCFGIAPLKDDSAIQSVQEIRNILSGSSPPREVTLHISNDDARMKKYLRDHDFDEYGVALPAYQEGESYTDFELDDEPRYPDTDGDTASDDEEMSYEFETLDLFELTDPGIVDWGPVEPSYVPF